MKKVIYVLLALVVGYMINARFLEVAYSLGFAELKQEAVLINAKNLKVKCHSYALGFFDELELENKFQQCVNEHLANGYKLLADLSTSQSATSGQ